jgi:hypothetical protein
MACKACLWAFMLTSVLLLYLLVWYTCDECIYILSMTSCAVSLLGVQYLAPACAMGVACLLFKGVHLGAGPFHFDMRWDA